jgi:hypothetical protein
VLHKDYPADAGAFLDAVAPYRDGLAVAVECMVSLRWAWAPEPASWLEGHDPS